MSKPMTLFRRDKSLLTKRVRVVFLYYSIFFSASHHAFASNKNEQPLLDVFPPSVAAAEKDRQGSTSISLDYTPSTSLWAEGLDEKQVFHAQIQHDQNENNSFTLRIGKGGQVYSLRGPFGESVPPSCTGEGPSRSPWNDEVWQFVTVCSKYNGLCGCQEYTHRNYE